MDLNNLIEPLLIQLTATNLRLTDATIFNQLYDERLTIKLKDKKLAFDTETTTKNRSNSTINIPQIKLDISK